MRGALTFRRLSGSLAILTIAFQLAVSFGHVHTADLAPAAAATHAAGAPGGAPVHDDDRDCAICAVLHLGGTPMLAVAPPLATPATFAVFHHAVAVVRIGPLTDAAGFHARGPPRT